MPVRTFDEVDDSRAFLDRGMRGTARSFVDIRKNIVVLRI
jgi:hypothetical protein